MKYSIEGISKEKTIKSVELVKKRQEDKKRKVQTEDKTTQTTNMIIVNYLDGTQDIFDFNVETLKRIENIMTSQAKEYVDKNSKSFWVNPTFRLMLMLGAIICAGYGLCTGLSIPSVAIFGSGAVILGTAAIVGTIKDKDIKKYNFYLKSVSGKLNEYIEILKKENALVDKKEQQNVKITGIRELDKTSTKTLNEIVTKVERHHEIEGKSPKIKNLENSRLY